MKILWIVLMMALTLAPITTIFSKEENEKTIQVCEISNQVVGRFFNSCPYKLVVDEVDVRVSGSSPYNLFTTVIVTCVKQTVVCSSK